jgi:putative addiction module killer protein
MLELRQTETFRKWRTRLRDERARALIASRLDRLAYGQAGDVALVGEGSANCASTMVRAAAFIFKGGAIR